MTDADLSPGSSSSGPIGVQAAAAIRNRALTLGFDAIGFARAALGPDARTRLLDFIAAGYHGDMGWLADRADQRAHPQALWPDARSVIALGMSYAPPDNPLATLAMPDRGTISVYARNRDYHDLIKGKLKQLAGFIAGRFGADVKVFTDTAPVMEKPLAETAGLGWVGKHTNLVSRANGSWLFLGEIYTTLDLEPARTHPNHCGGCSRCLTACPTAAFPAPYRLDATRCVSYLTIEHKGPIPHALRPLMGNRIYGCDDCLAACPWNKFATVTSHDSFLPRDDLSKPRLADLARLDDTSFRRMFSGSPIKRIGRDRFVRNVLNAIGNSGDPSLLAIAQALTADPSQIVSDSAHWAVSRLSEPSPPPATA